MKLVSAAKLRRAQDAAQGGRSFSSRLGSVMSQVAAALPADFSHPLFEERDEIRTRGVVLIAGERGLCGAYNSNVFKSYSAKDGVSDVPNRVMAIGKRSAEFSRRMKMDELGSYESLPENAGEWPIAEMVGQLIESFVSGECDEVVVYYTEFVSAMTQEVRREVLLPFSNDQESGDEEVSPKFDPRPEDILEKLVPLLVQTKLTQAALESKASEHAARMTAMDSATRNADELIDKLRLFYNRARQTAITTELIDIVGGAEAANG
jgi:F-type H+-transporting ATPase subunit gamma